MIELRQSTAATLRVGPAVAVADGFTPVTTLALTTADEAELLKHTGGIVDISAATFAAITTADGWYDLSLTTSHTDTLGMLTVVVNDDSLMLPIHVRAMVITAAAWDAKYGVLKPTGVIAYGTLSGTHSSTTADLGTTAPAENIAGATLFFPDDGLSRQVDSYDTGTGIATFSPSVAVTLTNGDNWVLFASPPASTTNIPSVDVTKLGGDAQSLTDLKLFADAIVDPATSKLEGVKVVDSVTGLTLASGTIGSTGNTTTTLHLDGLTFGDDELNDYLLVIRDVSGSENHAKWITDWVLSTELATVGTLAFTPENAVDTYTILAIRQDVTGGSGLDAAGVRAAVGLAAANLDTQLSTIDTNVDAILVDTGTTLQAELDGIQADTEDIQVQIGAAGAGLTAVPWNASWDAEVQSEVDDALAATIADSIPADGTAPSVKQALYMLTQFMTERAVSATTVTVKKPDGTTTLFTLTLSDATTPVSITRAT